MAPETFGFDGIHELYTENHLVLSSASSLGTAEGRVLDRDEVVVVVMLAEIWILSMRMVKKSS